MDSRNLATKKSVALSGSEGVEDVDEEEDDTDKEEDEGDDEEDVASIFFVACIFECKFWARP